MGIIKLTDNWPALAFGSTLGDGNSLCLRSQRRARFYSNAARSWTLVPYARAALRGIVSV